MQGLILMIWAFVSVFIGVATFSLWLLGAEPMSHDKKPTFSRSGLGKAEQKN